MNMWLGPDYHLAAAMSFYRALRVYPAPVELIVIYQKTVPEPIFKVRNLPTFSRTAVDHHLVDGHGHDKPGRKFTP